MSWSKHIPIAAIAVIASAPALAATIVVKSSGPSAGQYQPGRSLADNAPIVLKANDQLVILDGRGTRTLKGPGTFSTTQANGAGGERTSFTALTQERSARRARTGAVRAMPTPAVQTRSPNIWFVDTERSSSVCLTDPTRVTLWRSDAGRTATATLTRLADGKSEKIAWTKGQTQKDWPIAMPVSNGSQYRLSWPGSAEPTILSFKLLSPNPTGLEDMASALITNGCEAQLDLLIETVAIPGKSEGPAG